MQRIALIVQPEILPHLQTSLRPKVGPTWSFFPLSTQLPLVRLLQDLRQIQPTGIICNFDADLMEALQSFERPIILLMTDMILSLGVSINVNAQSLGKLSADYFFNKGLRSFAYFGIEALHAQEKRDAYLKTLQIKNQPVSIFEYTHESITKDSAKRKLESWLTQLDKPTGIFLNDATLSRVLIESCQRLQLKIPEEISILLGEQNTAESELIYPTLTSIETPWMRIVDLAMKWIETLQSGEPAPEDPIMIDPGNIITRASSDFFVTQDPWIDKALAFLREHPKSVFNVADLVRAIGCDRRTLERLCREKLNRSPLQIIRDHRLENARELLENTPISIANIAAECGFSAQDKLSKAFRKKFGITPNAWRKQRRKVI